MTHLSRLPLQSSRKAAEYLAEEQTVKPALAPAFPGMITVLYTAGRGKASQFAGFPWRVLRYSPVFSAQACVTFSRVFRCIVEHTVHP